MTWNLAPWWPWVGIGMSLLLCAAAYLRGRRDGKKARVEHKPRLVAIQHEVLEKPDGPFGIGLAGKVTIALYRCDCCDVAETKSYRGTWTVEQLTSGTAPGSAKAAVDSLLRSR